MTADDALPDELDMMALADVEFVKASGDPALWHEAAFAALAYVGDAHGFLRWLVQQPQMDRATAGWLLFWPEGSNVLRGQTPSLYASVPDGEIESLLIALCERSARLGFSQDRLGLDADFEAERQACQAVVARGELADGIASPAAIIDRPFPPPSHGGRYQCDDGMLVNKRLFQLTPR